MLHKFRSALANREAKIITMNKTFEPAERVKDYSRLSLDLVRQDYVEAVKGMQNQDKARLAAIEEKYQKLQPTQIERHQRLALQQSELRSLSVPQLKKVAEDALGFPPFLSDVYEVRAIGAECRERGLIDTADELATFVQAQKIASPHVHDPEYKRINSRIKKLDTYIAQAADGKMIITAEDPDHIAAQDIIMLDGLKADLSPARGVSS